MSESPVNADLRGRISRVFRAHPKLVLAALAALLFLPGLGGHDLWNPDEPRYAEVTREMLANGELFVPHLNGDVYTHKPPVIFWAMGLASLLLGGLTETAARLPSALAGIGTVLLVHGIGRRIFGSRTGFLSAVVLATSVQVLWQSRTGQIDMLLAFFVTLTAYLWIRAFREVRPGLYLVGFAVAGVGTVTKGPVALLPILFSFLAFFLLTGQRREIRRMRMGRGLLVWAGVVLAWLVPASLSAGGSYLHELVVTQNLTRYTAEASYAGTQGHLHPWYYYFTVIPAEFLPWSLFLPGAAIILWRNGNSEDRRASMLLACWAAITVLFFSLSPAKRSVYVLQMYPAMALLVGGGLVRLERSRSPSSRWLSIPAVLLALLLGFLAWAVALFGPARPEAAALPPSLPIQLAAVLSFLAVASLAAAWLASGRRILASVALLAAGFAVAALAVLWGLLPGLDPVKSVRPIAQRFAEVAGPEKPYGIFPELEPALLFYTGRFGRVLETEAELREFLNQEGSNWLFVERDDLRRLQGSLPVEEVARGPDPNNGYVLFVSPPRSESGSVPTRDEHGEL